MVDLTKNGTETELEISELIQSLGMSKAAISREIVRYGGKATPAGVGKWLKSGQVSRKNMDALRALVAAKSGNGTQNGVGALSVRESTVELRVVLLRNAVNSLNRAFGAMAMVLAKTRPDEAREVLSLFESLTPPFVDDDGISDRLQDAMKTALNAAEGNSTSRRKKSHPDS